MKKIILQPDTAVCALEGCGKRFKKGSHNAKYCSKEHSRIATNKRILQRYHERKRLASARRVCLTPGCGTILSVYNQSQYCARCADKYGWY